jgi:hypothetical protein
VRQVARASRGLARRVNLIADKALLATFADNRHEIRGRDIRTAVRETAFADEAAHRFTPAHVVIVLLVTCVVAAAVWYAFRFGDLARLAASSPAFAALIATVAPAPARHSAPVVAVPVAPAHHAAARSAVTPQRPAPIPTATAPHADPAGTEKAAAKADAAAPTPDTTKTASVAIPVKAVAIPAAPASTPPADGIDQAHAVILARADPAPPTTPANLTHQDDATAAADAAPAAEPASDLLQQRLDATRRWLKDSATSGYSIQLMWSRDPDTLRTRIDAFAKMLESNKIFIYRIEKKRKTSMVVLYGSFDDRDAAKRALTQLPQTLKIYRPYLRTLSDIRQEAAEFSAS